MNGYVRHGLWLVLGRASGQSQLQCPGWASDDRRARSSPQEPGKKRQASSGTLSGVRPAKLPVGLDGHQWASKKL